MNVILSLEMLHTIRLISMHIYWLGVIFDKVTIICLLTCVIYLNIQKWHEILQQMLERFFKAA